MHQKRYKKNLADCLHAYKEYLDKEKLDSAAGKRSLTPARTLDNDATIEHIDPCEILDEKYDKIDQAVICAGIYIQLFLTKTNTRFL